MDSQPPVADDPLSLRENFLDTVHSEEELFRRMHQWAKERDSSLPFLELASQSTQNGTRPYSGGKISGSLPDGLLSLSQYVIEQLKSQKTAIGMMQNKKEIVDLKLLERIEQQLRDEAVFICFLGRYNSGKTTLINGLLGIEVLPVSDRPETATTLYIQNDERSNLVSDVRLIQNNADQASGIEDVRECLESMHSGIRKKSKMMVDNYVLKTSFPAIKSNKPRAFVVDTPGSNEVGEDQLQQLAEIVLKTASAYVYVMSYSDIKNRDDYRALKHIYDRDKEIFYSERLSIVVTHYDRYFEGTKSTAISREEIKTIITSTISSEIGAKISPDIVFPVAGKWACKARTFLRTHSSSVFNDVELGLVSVYRVNEPGKRLGEYSAIIDEMGKEKAAKKLEDISGICSLEKRVCNITLRLSEIWKRNIVTGCCAFLETATQAMEGLEASLQNSIKDTTTRLTSAEQVITYHKAMTDSVRRNSSAYSSLRDAFGVDTSYEKKYLPQIDRLLNELKRTIKAHRRDKRKYTLDDLDKDVNEEFAREAEAKMMNLFHQTKFFSCQRQLRFLTQRVSEKFGRLRASASLVVEGENRPQSIKNYLKATGNNIEDEELSQALGEVGKNLDDIDLSTIIKVPFSKKIALWTVPWPFSVEVVKDEDIDRVITDRRLKLQDLHREFIDSVCSDVMLYFFKGYCRIVIKELRIFQQQYEENKEQIFDQLQLQKKQIAGQERDREKILQAIDNFKTLEEKLRTYLK